MSTEVPRNQVVTVHLPAYADPYQRCLLAALNEAGVPSAYCRPFSLFGWLDLSILASMVKFRRFRVFHLHWQHPYIAAGTSAWGSAVRALPFLAQLLLVKLTGRRIVWTIHNLVKHDATDYHSELFRSRAIARLADGIFAHCEYAREQAVDAYRVRDPKKISVIPHGHFATFFPSEVDRRRARERLAFDDDRFVFAFVGLIRPYKGVLDLAQSFQRLRGDHRHCHLLIAGKSGQEDMSAALAGVVTDPDSVQLHLGYVPDDEIQIYMKAADVIVTPYRDILTSGSAITAMSFGRPVIAPAIGCIPETLGPDSPLTYATDDEEGLYRCMRWAVENPEQLARIGDANRETALTWDWHRIAAATATAYGVSAQKPGARPDPSADS